MERRVRLTIHPISPKLAVLPENQTVFQLPPTSKPQKLVNVSLTASSILSCRILLGVHISASSQLPCPLDITRQRFLSRFHPRIVMPFAHFD